MRDLGLTKPLGRTSLGAASLLLLAILAVPPGKLAALQQPAPGNAGSPGGEAPDGSPDSEAPELPVRDGYVFLDGEYLPPPYVFKLTKTGLAINGRELTCKVPQRFSYGMRGPGGGEGFGGGGFGRSGFDGSGFGGPRSDAGVRRGSLASNPWRRQAFELPRQLMLGCAVLAFRDQPLVVFEVEDTYNLLKSLTTVEGRAMRWVGLLEHLPAGFNADRWDEWISGYQSPADLRSRALAMIATHEASARKAESQVITARWINQLEYPLTVGAMVVAVLAIGHLLGGRPHAHKPTTGLDESPEMIHTLNWSLFFAATLSGLDLAWTLIAAAAGQMREVNPIGSHLIENPRHLAGFKIALTVAALGVLWVLRRHKRAQIAAWWICLILTLVTIRWLTFSTMFLPPV
jgi:hypothetical protein